ncbi:hypothetical protein AN964_10900 [Heyndrickxia shackletonii]|uniref:Uncharacterized protein n=1 Tax=Heyndrickxia shackletonii TaxID=157838 RepID=A0A0Q3WXU6_9BACI|nr:hypothetical protein [Heyndrickxia shackletonii]KQL53956.1 hypothetical protein AN964_10900 [Heyndrickxia shackletonii]MBB2478881.1 hypothetical protein [Bacillus sp. APMAM]NEY97758.1 hypothetical protein [Heyndrickxia shackletonii]RTZ57630.1 hypothetical protein EKO25_01525 [Bacillus sp. SAJ1]
MEWTLAILFVVSALLLIISIIMTRRASKAEQKGIDMVHLSVMDDINNMQDSIRNLEFDIEIMMKEAGIQLSSEKRAIMREVLDLYKRKYSIESIAAQKQVSENEIKQILSSYLGSKDEGGKVANEI